MERKPRYEIRMMPSRSGGEAERWLTRDDGVPLLRFTTEGQVSQISDNEAYALARRISRLLNADEVVQTPGHYAPELSDRDTLLRASGEDPKAGASGMPGYVLHYYRKRGNGPVEQDEFNASHSAAFIDKVGMPRVVAQSLIKAWNEQVHSTGLVYTLGEATDDEA